MGKQQKMGRTPPPIDLVAFAGEHLLYEAQMFVGARALVPRNQFEMNAKIELCVIHFRNIVEFFYSSTFKADDVIALDYVPDWETKRPPITAALENARTRANKELAHLTTKRIAGGPPQKAWDFDALSGELRIVISAFRNLQPSKIPNSTISELSKV